MATTLGYSTIEQTNTTTINNEDSQNIHEQRRKNRTIKNRSVYPSSNDKVENMIKHLNLSSVEEDGNGLADFNPPNKPMSSGVERTKNTISSVENFQSSGNEEMVDMSDENDDNEDTAVTAEGFQHANGTYSKQYFEQHVPYYANASNIKDNSSSNPEIMNKINYLVTLIENNNDEKVNSITEELVLYCFLGVFIIFIVDSFAKVGKYVR